MEKIKEIKDVLKVEDLFEFLERKTELELYEEVERLGRLNDFIMNFSRNTLIASILVNFVGVFFLSYIGLIVLIFQCLFILGVSSLSIIIERKIASCFFILSCKFRKHWGEAVDLLEEIKNQNDGKK